MSLPTYIYKIFENIVGQDNISDKEHIMAAYRHWSPQSPQKPPSPAAVILPGSTEEVQSIVRICNRYNIGYTAQTSLFGMGFPGPETVILNMRRMNKILEINEADRYAVIEPSVRHLQLKPEVLKHGLNYPTASVGPSCSVGRNQCRSTSVACAAPSRTCCGWRLPAPASTSSWPCSGR